MSSRTWPEHDVVGKCDASLARDQAQPDVWMERGVALLALGQIADARMSLEEAARTGHASAGRILHESLEAPIAPVTTEGILLRNRGWVQLRLGNFDAALEHFTGAIAFDPQDADAYCQRGNTRREQHDVAGAIADFTSAIDIRQVPAYYGDRAASRMDAGDFRGVVADCTTAIALSPNDFVAHLNRGRARVRTRAFAEAIADFTAAIEIAAETAPARRVRALVCRAAAWLESGNVAAAVEDGEAAIALDPSCADAQTTLQDAKQRQASG